MNSFLTSDGEDMDQYLTARGEEVVAPGSAKAESPSDPRPGELHLNAESRTLA